jgi:RNA polymerase sigma-70 factor (ECF subfamily)
MPVATPDHVALQHARFNALVVPQLDRLLDFARRRTDELGDAEDAVQETCIRAWGAMTELRDDALVRPWLYRILRNVLFDVFEKSGRRRSLVPISRLEDTHESLVATDADFVFTEVAARIDSESLRAALDAIPEDFSRAVELHDIDGFKYQEIADIEGVAIGTVMSRISRGRRLLAGAIASSGLRSTATLGSEKTTRAKRASDRGTA